MTTGISCFVQKKLRIMLIKFTVDTRKAPARAYLWLAFFTSVCVCTLIQFVYIRMCVYVHARAHAHAHIILRNSCNVYKKRKCFRNFRAFALHVSVGIKNKDEWMIDGVSYQCLVYQSHCNQKLYCTSSVLFHIFCSELTNPFCYSTNLIKLPSVLVS